MARLGSTRLEALFGRPPAAVTAEDVERLVTEQVAEAYDLDFKLAHYGRSDAEKRDLCGDVAALANTAGGVIVLGIAEDDHARALAAPGVEVSDAQVARIRQIVASGVSPLPTFDVHLVPTQADPDLGFVLIVVPRSFMAPHAVLVNESLKFPKRNGATTRWLAEPEVASAYRERLAAAAERGTRMTEVESALRVCLPPAGDAWLQVTLVPDAPGDMRIDAQTHSAFAEECDHFDFAPVGLGLVFRRVRVASRRLRADDAYQADDTEPWAVTAEFHTDGSGTIAVRSWDIRQGVSPSDPSLHTISEEHSAEVLLFALRALSQHAQDRAHTTGTAALHVAVQHELGLSLALGNNRGFFPSVTSERLTTVDTVSEYGLIETMAAGGPGLVATAARAHTSLGNVFGLPELRQLTIDGALRTRHWHRERLPYLTSWAASRGVELLDD